MLPQHLRLRKSADFVTVLRRGRKVARPTLILYARTSDHPRFGLVVGKRVGDATQRNTIKRRLRHRAMALIDDAQPLDVVVRALPGAALSKAALVDDFSSAWEEASNLERTRERVST